MAGKPLSWKWKIAIALIVLIIVGVGFVFTPWGHDTMRSWVDKAYLECPQAERANSQIADSQMTLAWWMGTICGQREKAMLVYKDFLGILDTEGKNFFDWKDQGRTRWNGKFEKVKDSNTYYGWGILHERACEAYWEYLNLYCPYQSGQFGTKESLKYFVLFHEIYPQITKTHKPHPKFYKYWDKLRNSPQFVDPRYGLPPQAMPKPPEYEGPMP